jgi:hypothetical protein
MTITADDLAIWKAYPNTAFTLNSTTLAAPGDETGQEFRLGTFELRENLSLSEK